jgi:MFS family permease
MLTLLQTRVANEYQGRIFGALSAIQAIALLIGMSMAGGLGDRIGIVPMLLIDASFNILASLLAFALIRVHIQTVQLPPEINPVAGQLLEQEVPTL